MLSKRTTTKLEEMKGKTFLYGGKIHCILDYTDNDADKKVTVKTNLKSFERTYEAIFSFLGEFEVCESPVVLPPAVQEDKQADESISRADKMIALLEDNIAKVQENASYIPQATCINNNVNAIINIEKMRFKAMQQKRRNK